MTDDNDYEPPDLRGWRLVAVAILLVMLSAAAVRCGIPPGLT